MQDGKKMQKMKSRSEIDGLIINCIFRIININIANDRIKRAIIERGTRN